MELMPRDLGTERYLTIIRKRLTPAYNPYASGQMQAQENVPALRRRGRRGRLRARVRNYWVKDLNVDD